MKNLIPTTTIGGYRQHLAQPGDLLDGTHTLGRFGTALCGETVRDQQFHTTEHLKVFGANTASTAKQISDLPMCKRCAEIASKETPSA